MNHASRGPLIGRLNTILHDADRRIRGTEYLQLEQALFVDGVVEELELEVIVPLLDRHRHRFVDPNDRRRLQTIVEGHAYNWDTYCRQLDAQGLPSRTDTVTMSALQQTGLADERARVLAIEVASDGAVVVKLQKQGRAIEWRFRGTERSLARIDAMLRPCSLYEIFLALEDYRAAAADDATRSTATHALSSVARWFRDTHTWRDFYRHYYREGRRNADDVASRVQQLPPRERVAIGPYDFLFGVEPPDDVRTAIRTTLDYLMANYPGVETLLRGYGLTIELYSWEALMRGATDFSQPPRRTGGYSPESHTMQLNVDLDPQAIAFVLVHEIGHSIYRALRDGLGEEEISPEAVIAHHFIHLNNATESGVQRRFPRHYMATEDFEWFPDAVAIMVLGGSGLAFRGGLHSLFSGQAVGYDTLYHDLQQWDPVGFGLVTTVVDALRAPVPSPGFGVDEALLSTLMGDPDERAFFAERDRWQQNPTMIAASIERFCARFLDHAGDRIMRHLLQQLVEDPRLPVAARQRLLVLTKQLLRYYDEDDRFVRIHGQLLHRLGRAREAYRVLQRFERRHGIDCDQTQEEIAVATLIDPTATTTNRRFMLRWAAPLIVHRLTQYAEEAMRVPRVSRRPDRPGRPPTERPAASDPRDAAVARLLALDQALSPDFLQRARRLRDWSRLQTALRALVDRLAREPRLAAHADTLRRRYRLPGPH